MYMWIWKDISRQEAILILWNKTKVLKIYSRMRSYHRAGAKDVGAGVAAAEVERPAWPARASLGQPGAAKPKMDPGTTQSRGPRT